jgi:hypothetical protein
VKYLATDSWSSSATPITVSLVNIKYPLFLITDRGCGIMATGAISGGGTNLLQPKNSNKSKQWTGLSM